MRVRTGLRNAVKAFTGPQAFAQINFNYLRLKSGLPPRLLNLKTPTSFTEKVVWLKLNHRIENASILADKLRVRTLVRDRIGDKYLVPLLGVYERVEDIEFNELPQKFVLKPNHASGKFYFADKTNLDDRSIKDMCRSWLALDYGAFSGEYQYADIPRRILAEVDLREEASGKQLGDYRFFCFNGKPTLIQQELDIHGTTHRRNFYDLQWRRQPVEILFPQSNEESVPPSCLVQMIDIAEALSKDLPFARIDLYEASSRVYFSEITLHPGGGVAPVAPDSSDRILGALLDLPSSTASHLR